MPDYSNITPEIIQRHNRRGPRYTSYPTVPNWLNGDFEQDYRKFLKLEREKSRPLSLYIHIPFCKRLCTFCGCNRYITRDSNLVENYLKALEMELDQIATHTGHKAIGQLHLGGGTPTYLTVPQLQRVDRMVADRFQILPEGEKALEVHPKVTSSRQLKALADLGFNRISLGVQDLDPAVQKAINRDQTVEETRSTVETAREYGFKSVNIDLVYGLPKQNLEGFRKTLETVDRIRPDRLAVYNFAYIPGMFKAHKRAIHPEDLPVADIKIDLYIETIKFLTEVGYVMIGMDHYSLPEDELTKAQKDRSLHRNFMGYTTLRGHSQIGIGVSSISDFGNAYFQNEKNLHAYIEAVQGGQLPARRACLMDDDDVMRRDLIETLMCHAHLDFKEFEARYGINFKNYFSGELNALKAEEESGLIIVDEDSFRFTEIGLLFMRNIAMIFDQYLAAGGNMKKGKKSDRQQFSATV